MAAELPLKIVNNIISFIDDSETAIACTLVRPEWLPASRYNYFNDGATIDTRRKFDNLVRLRDPSRIAPYLFSLLLGEDIKEPWLHLLPIIPPNCFTHVRSLVLHNFQWNTHPLPQAFYTIGNQFPSLTELQLTGGSLHSFEDLQRLLTSFKRLVQLFITRVGWRNLPSQSHFISEDRSRLEILWFDCDCEGMVAALADWLLRTPTVLTLRDLKLGNAGVQNKADLPAIQRLTRELGPILEHIEISMKEWSTKGDVIDLSQNTSLRTLYVRHVTSGSLTYLALLLGERISPTNLTELTLDLYISTLDELHNLQTRWYQLDKILAGVDFQLSSVTIWLRQVPSASTSDLEGLVATIESWMPALKSGKSEILLFVKPWVTLLLSTSGSSRPIDISDAENLAASRTQD